MGPAALSFIKLTGPREADLPHGQCQGGFNYPGKVRGANVRALHYPSDFLAYRDIRTRKLEVMFKRQASNKGNIERKARPAPTMPPNENSSRSIETGDVDL